MQSGIKDDQHAKEEEKFHFSALLSFSRRAAFGMLLTPRRVQRIAWTFHRGKRPVEGFPAVAAAISLEAPPAFIEAEQGLFSGATHILAAANRTTQQYASRLSEMDRRTLARRAPLFSS